MGTAALKPDPRQRTDTAATATTTTMPREIDGSAQDSGGVDQCDSL
jgi:hypothetical protein